MIKPKYISVNKEDLQLLKAKLPQELHLTNSELDSLGVKNNYFGPYAVAVGFVEGWDPITSNSAIVHILHKFLSKGSR